MRKCICVYMVMCADFIYYTRFYTHSRICVGYFYNIQTFCIVERWMCYRDANSNTNINVETHIRQGMKFSDDFFSCYVFIHTVLYISSYFFLFELNVFYGIFVTSVYSLHCRTTLKTRFLVLVWQNLYMRANFIDGIFVQEIRANRLWQLIIL